MNKSFTELTWYERFCINVIKQGRIPKHVAFIMDGNRRYIEKKKIQGLKHGTDKFHEVLKWCVELGVQEATFYALSIQNFKRSKESVEEIMDNVTSTFIRIMDNINYYHINGIRFRIVGNYDLLSSDLNKLIDELHTTTKDNRKLSVTIALAYTFSDELTTSVKAIVDGIKKKSICIDDIDEKLVYDCLCTNFISKPDVLIRTSGETRFSDFLLWQMENANVYFINQLWPEITIWQVIRVYINYQIYCKENQEQQQVSRNVEQEKRIEIYFKELKDQKFLNRNKSDI